MPDTPYPQNGQPASALLETQQLLLTQGYAWVTGLDASLTNNLNLSLTNGDTLHAGTQSNHASQTVTLPDPDPADPRWVLVYATPSGVDAVGGDPDSVANYPTDPALQLRYEGATRMATPIPALPDLASVFAATNDKPVALWAVWLPAGATDKGDLVDGEQHLFDRRIERSATTDVAGSLVSENDYTVRSLSATNSINTDDLIVGSENTVSSFGNGIAVDNGALTSPDQPTSDLQWTLVASGRTSEATGVVGLNWDKLKLVVHTDGIDASCSLLLRVNTTVSGACNWRNQDGSTGSGGRFQLFTTNETYRNVSGTFELTESYNRTNRGHTITGQAASRDRDVTYLRDGYVNVGDVGNSIDALSIQPMNVSDMEYEVWGRDMPV